MEDYNGIWVGGVNLSANKFLYRSIDLMLWNNQLLVFACQKQDSWNGKMECNSSVTPLGGAISKAKIQERQNGDYVQGTIISLVTCSPCFQSSGPQVPKAHWMNEWPKGEEIQGDSVARQFSQWTLWSEDQSQEGGLPPSCTNIAQMSTERRWRWIGFACFSTEEC